MREIILKAVQSGSEREESAEFITPAVFDTACFMRLLDSETKLPFCYKLSVHFLTRHSDCSFVS